MVLSTSLYLLLSQTITGSSDIKGGYATVYRCYSSQAAVTSELTNRLFHVLGIFYVTQNIMWL